jgi:para-nitrobenzyl esterase
VFRIPAVRLAEAAHAQGSPVWKYLFTWCSPALNGALGSCHALELPFVFGTATTLAGLRSFVGEGPALKALSARMQEAWLAFARDGAPVSRMLGDWPHYTPERRSTMVLGETCRVEHAPRDLERAFWDGLL